MPTLTTRTSDVSATILPADRLALRHADAVVLRSFRGLSTIECITRENGTLDNERTHVIPVNASVRDYGAETYFRDLSDYSAFTMFHSGPKYHDVLRSIVGRIANGDSVTLMWERSDGSPATREHAVVCDSVKVRITSAKGKCETYLADTYAGPDNTARMVNTA